MRIVSVIKKFQVRFPTSEWKPLFACLAYELLRRVELGFHDVQHLAAGMELYIALYKRNNRVLPRFSSIKDISTPS